MKYIDRVPSNVEQLYNSDLKRLFEDEVHEPLLHTNLKACGYVGNRPSDFEGDEHEDDTWAIDQYDENGEEVYESFLYVSEFEYEHDCKIIGLSDK